MGTTYLERWSFTLRRGLHFCYGLYGYSMSLLITQTTRAPSQYKDGPSRYGYFYYKDDTVVRPSYRYNENPFSGETPSVNGAGPRITSETAPIVNSIFTNYFSHQFLDCRAVSYLDITKYFPIFYFSGFLFDVNGTHTSLINRQMKQSAQMYAGSIFCFIRKYTVCLSNC